VFRKIYKNVLNMLLTYFFPVFSFGRVFGYASLRTADCHHSSASHRYTDCMNYSYLTLMNGNISYDKILTLEYYTKPRQSEWKNLFNVTLIVAI
jgi:hypothetical protein